MIVYELTNTENNPIYQQLEVENGNRQYDFIRSIVDASIAMGRPFLSQHLVKALNFHAITCLHISPGEYRPHDVRVGSPDIAEHLPMPFYRVQAAMDDFVNLVNRNWDNQDPVALATYVLWRLNNIHPFVNGNGRSARASAYYVLCVKSGGWLPGTTILPELIKRDRSEYCDALQHGHTTFNAKGEADLVPLHTMLTRLLDEQLASDPVSGE